MLSEKFEKNIGICTNIAHTNSLHPPTHSQEQPGFALGGRMQQFQEFYEFYEFQRFKECVTPSPHLTGIAIGARVQGRRRQEATAAFPRSSQ